MACLALLVFFLFAAAPTYCKDFWNIDCGGISTFTTANGLQFEGDGSYIHTGVIFPVPGAADKNISTELWTVRAFPKAQLMKNCYRIAVEQGTKVLVRTRHYYGNYDGLNSQPSFIVYFDTALTCDVRSDSTSELGNICEAVYETTKKQGTDICLVRTKDKQTPFISTIEIRRLLPNMYSLFNFTTQALLMARRFAFGAPGNIGYPNDNYNRIWEANNLVKSQAVIVKYNGVAEVNTTEINDAPPALLFHAAAVAPAVGTLPAAGNLTIRTTWLPSDPRDTYFKMYFREPISGSRTSSQQKRAINVYMDGALISNASNPIQPVYAFGMEYSSLVYKASNETVLVLETTAVSTLPPAISGMEAFLVNDVNVATNSSDVEVLSMLQDNFRVLKNWTGDPCLPTNYNWEWVLCNYDLYPPRIYELRLDGYGLSGSIPDFSKLDALEFIDLSNNSLTGKVPDFIANFRNLKTLDLSDNSLDGAILPSLLEKGNVTLTLIYKGNPKLESHTETTPSLAVCNIVGQCIFVLFLFLMASTVVL